MSRVRSHRSAPAAPNVRIGSAGNISLQAGLPSRSQPSFDFIKVPDYALRSQIEALREIAPTLHLIDRCVRQRHDLAQFPSAHGALARTALIDGIGLRVRSHGRFPKMQ